MLQAFLVLIRRCQTLATVVYNTDLQIYRTILCFKKCNLYNSETYQMDNIIILQVSRDELEDIVTKAVRAAMLGQQNSTIPKTQIKGIHGLAAFLKISTG